MLIYQSKLLGKARREAPADAETASHKLLARAGFIDQLGSGIFSLLPLGHLVNQKISALIRREMQALGAQEVLLPALQPALLWSESGRLTTMDPPLFRVTDRHKKELVLASTHEEVITDLARKNIDSYRDLPLSVFQIQTKFRNELRATGGLLRVREFLMKDMYSLHRDSVDLRQFFEKARQAYLNVFAACDLKVYVVEADSGPMGGNISFEFSTAAASGEDRVAVCSNCGWATNIEAQKQSACAKCRGKLEIRPCIENGHIFQLGTKYSQSLGALFTDEDGSKKPIEMGCYGIGVGRLLATIVETHVDEKGIIWPNSVTPFDVHIIALQESVQSDAALLARELSKQKDILFDDRLISAGQKFTEADLIGIPTRLVISEKNKAQGKIEVGKRGSKNTSLVAVNELANLL